MGKHFFDYEEKVGSFAATYSYADKLIFFNG